MSTVWLAEHADGRFRRRVALKLARTAWDHSFSERLNRERNILESLEHPHIARFLDAGQDEADRPYMVLEHVDGQAIDAYCEEHRLGIRERLRLLLQVCEAVAYAHTQLVIHRDLKPANILVTPQGQVKLLDFGIAKLMEGDRTSETALTALSGRALTLDYASPEQIRGEALGTASDVYSLGVVAFELLTGARPTDSSAGPPPNSRRRLPMRMRRAPAMSPPSATPPRHCVATSMRFSTRHCARDRPIDT